MLWIMKSVDQPTRFSATFYHKTILLLIISFLFVAGVSGSIGYGLGKKLVQQRLLNNRQGYSTDTTALSPTVPTQPTLVKFAVPTNPLTPPLLPPSVDVSKWKTYTNTAYGYAIQYPPNYTILPGFGGKPTLSNLLKFANTQGEYVTNIFIRQDPPITSTLRQWIQNNALSKSTNEVGKPQFIPMPFNNHNALLVEQRENQEGQLVQSYSAFLEKDNNTIIIVSSGMPGRTPVTGGREQGY